jgi:phage terminase small subunit
LPRIRADYYRLAEAAGTGQKHYQIVNIKLHKNQRIGVLFMSELTARQMTFIEELPKNNWNGTKAAIAAGYSQKSAGVMAHRLLNNPKVYEELDKRKAEIAQKSDVEIAEIMEALREIAFGGIKATNTERLRALELLGKHIGLFEKDNEQKQPAFRLVLGAPKVLPEQAPALPIESKEVSE